MSLKVFNVIGLTYGDEGKGSVIDFLAEEHMASLVIRYNGGPQAAHHVVRNGQVHCFSQFGSATLLPGVKTHLAEGMFVKPANLLVEAARLTTLGVTDPLSRITISPKCRLVTPLHAMIGQMLEVSRGHGSVGMGVGQAVLDSALLGAEALIASDIKDPSILADKLYAHYKGKMNQAEDILSVSYSDEASAIFQVFKDRLSFEALFIEFSEVSSILVDRIQETERTLSQNRNSVILLEGAQGVLLDPEVGFTPHVTKTRIVPSSANSLVEMINPDELVNVGVLRSFATRHGAGPFVTESPAFNLSCGESNNQNRWQGEFRYGYLDRLSIRYAVESSGVIDVLAVNCLDRYRPGETIRVCTEYQIDNPIASGLDRSFDWVGDPSGIVQIKKILAKSPVSTMEALSRTAILNRCKPFEFRCFDAGAGYDQKTRQFLSYLESGDGLGKPISIVGFGPAAKDKMYLKK